MKKKKGKQSEKKTNKWKTSYVMPIKKHLVTLFLLHGEEQTGDKMKETFDAMVTESEFKLNHIKIVYVNYVNYPIKTQKNAQQNPSSLFSHDEPESVEQINGLCKRILNYVREEESSRGIPARNIMIAGFSHGAVLAYHIAFRLKTSLLACIAVSGFLHPQSVVYEWLDEKMAKLESSLELPKLVLCHNASDDVTPIGWAIETWNNLKKRNVSAVTIIDVTAGKHEITPYFIARLRLWLDRYDNELM